MATRRQQYDIALNGQGLILASKPETPQLLGRQDDVFGQRFAQGDRDYNDLAKWWYMVQTDWSGGIKDETSFKDDAQFYSATNIDAYSTPGEIKLLPGLTEDTSFDAGAAGAVCSGFYVNVNGTYFLLIGTLDNASNEPELWRFDSPGWTNITPAGVPTSQNAIASVEGHKGLLYVGTLGVGNTYILYSSATSGGSDTDHSAAIATAMGWAGISSCHAVWEENDTLYASVLYITGNVSGIVKTVDNGANWVKVIGFTSQSVITNALIIGSNIFYLMNRRGIEFRQFNLTSSADSLIFNFPNQLIGSTYAPNRRYLHQLGSKLIITIPSDEIWEYDTVSGSLNRIFNRIPFRGSESDINSNVELGYGGTFHKYKIYWPNLVYDGNQFYNDRKNTDDSAISVPLVSDGTKLWYADRNDLDAVFYENNYKGTADKNYLILSNLDKVAGIDKLAYSVDIIFKALASGQKISVEYTTGELTISSSWTALGNANFTTDGAVTQKTLFFGDAVITKKIWFRVKLEGGGSNTPVLFDFIFAYLPMPDYRLRWDLLVKCEDEIQRKDQSKETKSGVWLRNYLQQSWLTKSILIFEDYDAAGYDTVSGSLSATATTITVTGTTDNFPERGRLLIESEEIFYTGKTKNTFTGCTRGARGTNKVTHADTTAISMGHRVIIRNYQEELIIANQPAKAEYRITLALSEV